MKKVELVVPASVQRAALHSLRRLVFNADVPWAKQRARFATAMLALRPGPGVARDEVDLGAVRCVRLTPAEVEPERAILYAHGGGYCIGSPAMGYALGAKLARELRATWFGVHYRLAPEHPAPAAVDDVAAVLGALAVREVVAIGDSAGAGALVAALSRGVGGVCAVVLVSPWLDLSAARDPTALEPLLSAAWLAACADAYAGSDQTSPEVSPIDARWEDLPPTLVVGASDDLLASDARRLRAKGVASVDVREFEGLWHDFALSVGSNGAADEAATLMVGHFARHAGWGSPTDTQ